MFNTKLCHFLAHPVHNNVVVDAPWNYTHVSVQVKLYIHVVITEIIVGFRWKIFAFDCGMFRPIANTRGAHSLLSE